MDKNDCLSACCINPEWGNKIFLFITWTPWLTPMWFFHLIALLNSLTLINTLLTLPNASQLESNQLATGHKVTSKKPTTSKCV